jgi:hypothetical protein
MPALPQISEMSAIHSMSRRMAASVTSNRSLTGLKAMLISLVLYGGSLS